MDSSLIAKPVRVASIDIFRALTMFFMIFVNDFWSVSGVPHWLEHAAASEDMLGFSDVVFPSFLFILGMSIPLAMESRMKKGETKKQILWHIVVRSVALLAMGLFTVNLESGVADETGISKPVFTILTLFGFFLIWNVYPKQGGGKKHLFTALKVLGVIILGVLAVIYRDGEGGLFQIRWWGILGLIGWTYLLCAIIYLFLYKNRMYLWIAGVLFILLCVAGSNHWLGFFHEIIPGNGCFHAFTMGGVLLMLLFKRPETEVSGNRKLVITFVAGIGTLLLGFLSHSFWIISKIQATPTWLFLCLGISLLTYAFIYWLTDMQGKASWFDIIKPAGTATLTCYLLPYLLYSIFTLINLQLPEALLVSPVGLLKCAVFSLLTIGLTALLVKVGVKLKI
ncbi:DUF5009 domain-containing protein [uncultured Dysgonomonas sp.]|uniref:DUF5009 domain-containing protein n=1 Tax=uncultured Dysgonomonas sp. TaxID=206096 RepID=A0A212JYC9_9BACT|nr:DUF5009 domain-containing protein [uncultured Dysgonomonas sp.]SBW04362.1 conserved membrane hypothetical protein [uncultured Dysgonomonas sp.]